MDGASSPYRTITRRAGGSVAPRALPRKLRPPTGLAWRAGRALRYGPALGAILLVIVATATDGIISREWGASLFALGCMWTASWRLRDQLRAVYWQRRYQEGVAMLDDGRADWARARFEGLVAESRFSPRHHSVYLTGLAAALSREGDPETASAILLAVRSSGWLGGAAATAVDATLVQLLVARGELDEAERELRVLETQSPRSEVHCSFAAAVLAISRCSYAQAIEALDAGWAAAGTSARQEPLKTMRVLKAYCLSRTEPESTEIEALLRAAEPIPPERFAQLVRAWPDLESFLETRRSLRSAAVVD